MGDLIAAFLAYLHERNRSPRTVDRYAHVLGAFEAFVGNAADAAMTPSAVTTDQVAAFLARRPASARQPSPGTRNVELAVLRAFWKFLLRRGFADRDPTAAVEFARLPKRDAVYLTLAEFDAITAAIGETASRGYRRRDEAIVTTAFHTGLRLSEILSLNIATEDLAVLTFHGVAVKGGNRVDVAFNGEVARAIERYLPDRDRLVSGTTNERALFVSDRGTRLSARAVQASFARYVRAAGIAKPVTFHALRHSTATHLLAAGENLMVVAEQLHHANLNTTRKYVHLAADARHRAVARLGERVRQERKARRAVARRARQTEASADLA